MSVVDNLQRQHREILGIVQQMSAGLDAGKLIQRESADSMRALLSQLSGKVSVHLAMEDKSLYPKLVANTNAATSKTAQRFVSDMGPIAEAFANFVKQWPTSAAISQQPTVFVEHTRAIFKALGDRVTREERELYPLALAA